MTHTPGQMLSMRVEQAGHADAADVMRLISRCILHMRANGIRQWDEVYPDLQNIREDVRASSLFVIRQNGRCVAAVSLNDIQPDEYHAVKWHCVAGQALVAHRLCVDPLWQGRGLGKQMMDFAESFAINHDFSCIRLDAYTGNPHAMALYERLGYWRVGQVYFPRRELPFVCFEKIF